MMTTNSAIIFFVFSTFQYAQSATEEALKPTNKTKKYIRNTEILFNKAIAPFEGV